ncbi:MAG TPA: alpha/beta hydrolase-fold protein [Phycisphaerae bacterium]|nr:alpha/beta hydrolase-fold protein [Phycisphaerae bacterium]
MHTIRLRILLLGILIGNSLALAAGEDAFYKLGPDSLPQEGVPHGKFVGPATLPSKVFPGTAHTYHVYVPAQYDPAKPASLIIFNDGQAFMAENGDICAQNVIDNLTHRREIPTMIAVFINPGHTPEQPEPTPANWGDRTTNRPIEYNVPDDKYSQVIVNELLPELYKTYNISKDPDQHAIAGASSGAIAAFTVAWERPDQFRKVISIVGSFTSLRPENGGGNSYPEKILAADKKPIRVFFQDGRNDNRSTPNNYDPTKDWFLQNNLLIDALTKKGYDINYTFGIGLHGQKQGGAILPEMMRWTWRDHARSTDPKDSVERSFAGPASQPATK